MTDSERTTIMDLLKHKSAEMAANERKSNLVDTLRKKMGSRPFKQKDTVLDEMVEQMGLCRSKAELLTWASKNVFEPFDKAQSSLFDKELSEHLTRYSELIPKLMEHIKENFHDPNLAMAIYKHAKTRSVASYVLGCSTNTYNILLGIVWDTQRDLLTIHSLLQEMVVNGVYGNRRTEAIVERIQQEATDDKLWLDKSPDGDRLAMVLLTKISEVMMKSMALDHTKSKVMERDWKLGTHDDKNYDFGNF